MQRVMSIQFEGSMRNSRMDLLASTFMSPISDRKCPPQLHGSRQVRQTDRESERDIGDEEDTAMYLREAEGKKKRGKVRVSGVFPMLIDPFYFFPSLQHKVLSPPLAPSPFLLLMQDFSEQSFFFHNLLRRSCICWYSVEVVVAPRNMNPSILPV